MAANQSNTAGVSWDTSAIQDKITLLRNEVGTIRALNKMYQELQARIEENWTGAAATVFLNELSIDVNSLNAMADNVDLLVEILTRAYSVFSTCTDEVSTNLQAVGENLISIR